MPSSLPPPTPFSCVEPDGALRIRLPEDVVLEAGDVLDEVWVGYQMLGPAAAPVVVVQGGISADCKANTAEGDPARAWWPEMVGRNRAVDTKAWRVLSFDYLGGNGKTSGPRQGQDKLISITPSDQASVLCLLLEFLGIPRIEAYVGASYGGMIGLAFAARFPHRIGRLAVLAASDRSSAMAIAWRGLQRRWVRWGLENGRAVEAMAMARSLAMTTYRSPQEFENRFDAGPSRTAAGLVFPVETYLEARGRAFAESFDPRAFLCLCESLDLQRVDPAQIRNPVTLLAFSSDQLVPVAAMRSLAARLAGPATLVELATPYGHDAFLKETESVGAVLKQFLEGGVMKTNLCAVTKTVRCGVESDRQHGAVMPPIYLSSNFSFAAFDEARSYDYTRSGNPTRDLLAEALTDLEGGAGGVVTSTGMSAITLVLQLLQPGELLLAPADCYGGTHRLMTALAKKGAFEVAFIDQTDELVLAAHLARNPRMVWIETPSNPLLRITDIRSVAKLAKGSDVLVVVDNTFLSPVCQRPLDLGADLVVHSTTKYLNGHSDVVGGAVIAGDPGLYKDLCWWANCLGITGAPFDSYLTMRGLRTLHARMAIHQQNALAVVELLLSHEAVTRVYHPSLADHPGHNVAASQQQGFGAMVSFELAGGRAQIRAFLDGLTHFSLAESLGGVESLVAHPATMTHAAMDAEARTLAGIGDALLRLSVGLEAAEDLRRDLNAALNRARGSLASETSLTPEAIPC